MKMSAKISKHFVEDDRNEKHNWYWGMRRHPQMAKRILILNGSPKQNGGTSRFLSKLIGVQLAGSHVEYASLRQKSAHADIVRRLSDIDVLVIASPLYVDGILSHVIEFLQAAEEFCTHNVCRFTVYAVSNNGFIEGSHNKSHLKMYECWCRIVRELSDFPGN